MSLAVRHCARLQYTSSLKICRSDRQLTEIHGKRTEYSLRPQTYVHDTKKIGTQHLGKMTSNTTQN